MIRTRRPTCRPHRTATATPSDRIASRMPEAAVTFTKAAAMWGALIFGFLILIVLLIFIAQNTESAEFAFLGWHWSLPLGWRSSSRRWPAAC